MLSRRALTVARVVQLRRPLHQPLRGLSLPSLMNQVRTYADTVVKVPQMAESISEGTLKQWSKQVGDYVEQDEEIATIETDKASDDNP
jgi:2-oxoglutarate dehydrogenase E2 component (dihydrolipoamide succinyltransferase)